MDSQSVIAAFTSGPQILLSVATALWLVWRLYGSFNDARKSRILTALPAPDFPPIDPFPDFNLDTAEPEKLRPFRGKERYNLTMALESLSPSDLLPLDKTYKARLAQRAALLKSHPDTVLGIHDEADPCIADAVCEYYTFVLGTYLPGRYPSVFKLHRTDLVDGSRVHMLENKANGELWPVEASESVGTKSRTRKALETLIRVVDEDVLFLLPGPSSSSPSSSSSTASSGSGNENGNEDGKYHLKAYATTFPSGFNPAQKLGLPLSGIHAPVPGYAEKLERSMDRFFGKLEPGRYAKRANWTVTTAGTELFAAFGGVHGDEGEGMTALRLEELDVDSTLLRCERQTVHRLPKSKAVVFAFHTYTYPIKEIKEEGLGEELAAAIDGLKAGNVPEMHVYKRGPVWGEAVKEYLRS